MNKTTRRELGIRTIELQDNLLQLIGTLNELEESIADNADDAKSTSTLILSDMAVLSEQFAWFSKNLSEFCAPRAPRAPRKTEFYSTMGGSVFFDSAESNQTIIASKGVDDDYLRIVRIPERKNLLVVLAFDAGGRESNRILAECSNLEQAQKMLGRARRAIKGRGIKAVYKFEDKFAPQRTSWLARHS